MTQEKRNEIIDILRGIAVLSVLLGHAIQRGMVINYEQNIIFKIIYSFHMPLFMLLSGYTMYKYTEKYDINFIRKKFIRLIIPTIVWSYLIYFVRNFEFVGIKEFILFPSNILEYTKTLFWHPDILIWFLYIVFLCNIIFYIHKKIVKDKYEKFDILVTILFTIIIYLLPNKNFGMGRLQIYFPIFSLGYYVAKYFEYIKKYLKYLLIPSIITYILIFSRFNVMIDNKLIYYLISISAIIIIYNIVNKMKLEKVNKVLAFLGNKSLEIYLCQCVCLNIGAGNGTLRIISIFITATTISTLLAIITNKYDITKALLYGKRRKHE